MLAGAGLAILTGCGGDAAANDGTCVPGSTLACECLPGVSGATICRPDGAGYGVCECGPGGGAGGAAGSAGSGGTGGGGTPMPSSGCGASEWPADGTITLDVEGTQRTYIVELPAGYQPNTPHKLVFAWHGFTITAAQVASTNTFANLGRFFGLEPRAGGSAIFVAPQGLDTMLLGQSGPGWDNMNGRDVAFARAMVESLRASYCIDDARIFSAGVSMGGYLSNQLGCEMADVFRAVASIIGGGPIGVGTPQCQGPMPAWITHGNMDQINPFTQGVKSRDYWANANHCTTMTTPVAPATCVAYEGCDAGYPVHWCEFDGNHSIPNFAAEGMWSFFSQF